MSPQPFDAIALETLTAHERKHLDMAEQLGKHTVRLHANVAVLTPAKLDRLAEANARLYITHKDYPRLLDYARMTQLFIRVFVDAYAMYQRTYK